MTTYVPKVVDIYRGDSVKSFQAAKDSGVIAIIHKASQGATYKDPVYKTRRADVESLGMAFGAYHFNSGDNVKTQVDNFMTAADPSERTLMVLDFEDNRSSPMSIQHAVEFLHLLEERIGRKGAIYSGNRLKETILQLKGDDLDYVLDHRLWLCQYGPVAKLPKGFSKYWLWQFTGDGIGPMPHYVPGITVPGGKGIDLNRLPDGVSDEDFLATWA